MARAPVPRPESRIPQYQPRAEPGGVPVAGVPGIATPSAGLTGGLIVRLERLAAATDVLADREAVLAAEEAGRAAGEAAPGTRMEGGGSLYRRSFNRAAEAAAQLRLELAGREELDRLARAHEADPQSFADAARAWRDGAATRLPEPWRAPFLLRFDAAALPYLNALRDAAQRRVADDAAAAWEQALPHRLAAIERAAARAFDDPAAREALRLEEDAAVADAVRLGPRGAFVLDGREIAPDPSRAGALSALQVARAVERIRAARTEALAIAAWRAAGATREWIDEFERRQTAPELAPWLAEQAQAARPFAAPERLLARLPAGWTLIIRAAAAEHGLPADLLAGLIALESGGRADAVSRAGAVGPAQILPSTAADPGFGVAPLPAEALTDATRAIPWAAQYLAALRRHFGGDLARAVAAYNAGVGTVERAERDGRPLPEETRRYLATLLPLAVEAMPALPAAEARSIAARLRGLYERDRQIEREARAAARAALEDKIKENLAAIEASGAPVHRLTAAELTAAGYDAAKVLDRERAAIDRFAATEMARRTTEPAALAALAEAFAPGTPNFAADPVAAVRLLNAIEQRGVAVRHAALAERVRDLVAEAETTGRAGAITAEEAAAAGLTPEKRDEINRDLALRAELARLRSEAERLPEAERAAMLARFPTAGEGARANAERVRVIAEAFEARDKAVREDAAAYALAASPEAQALARRVATGDLSALGPLVARLRAEQDTLGIDPALRRDLPKPIAEGLFATIAEQPDADAAWATLERLTAAVGVSGVERLAAEWQPDGARREVRRNAIVVAAAKAAADPALARELLRGAFVLRDNPVLDATRTNVQLAVQSYVGEALAERPDVRAQLADAALALLAAQKNRAGRLADVWRPAEFGEALERLMPTDVVGGVRTPLPPGMDRATFRDLLRALPEAALAGAQAADGRAITPAMLARGGFTLHAIAPGRYRLRWGGYDVLDAARPGQAFVLDLNGLSPVPPTATSPTRQPPRRTSPRAAVRPIEGWDDDE